MERGKKPHRRLTGMGAASWLARSTSARLRKRPQQALAAQANLSAAQHHTPAQSRRTAKVIPFAKRRRR